jgi:hypothetical protein
MIAHNRTLVALTARQCAVVPMSECGHLIWSRCRPALAREPFAVSATSMLPRVALEYGQTRCPVWTRALAAVGSLTEGRMTSRVTASLKSLCPVGSSVILESIATSPASCRARRAATLGALLKQAAGPIAKSCSGWSRLLLGARTQLNLQGIVAGATVTLGSIAGQVCLCRVENLAHPCSRPRLVSKPPVGAVIRCAAREALIH